MLGFDAAKKIDIHELDFGILRSLEAHERLVELVDNWILIPDREQIQDLQHHSAELNRLQKFRLPAQLYRGFDPSSPYQNTMGLQLGGFLFKKVKQHKVGDVFGWKTEHPVSFTTDLDIAKAFGPTVVQIDSKAITGDYLYVGKELSYLICQRRNVSPNTQYEVILFPFAHEISYKVLSR